MPPDFATGYLLLFFLASRQRRPVRGDAPLAHELVELAIGVAGAQLPEPVGTAARVRKADELDQRDRERLAVLVLPMLAYLTAMAVSGNGFVAAFVAGIAAGTRIDRGDHRGPGGLPTRHTSGPTSRRRGATRRCKPSA